MTTSPLQTHGTINHFEANGGHTWQPFCGTATDCLHWKGTLEGSLSCFIDCRGVPEDTFADTNAEAALLICVWLRWEQLYPASYPTVG